MRVGIGFGWTTLVAAEMIAAKADLGPIQRSAPDGPHHQSRTVRRRSDEALAANQFGIYLSGTTKDAQFGLC